MPVRRLAAKRLTAKPLRKKTQTSVKKAPLKRKAIGTLSEAKKRGGGVTGYAGAAGWDQSKREQQRAARQSAKRGLPYRLWMPAGSERDVIIISPEPFFMFEHEIMAANGKDREHERCIKDEGHCPLCTKLNKEGYYVMMLECLDLQKFTRKNGERATFSKRLMAVKQGLHNKYKRLYERNGNSFFGLKLHLIRDGKKDFTIGNEVEVIGKVSRQKLVAKYGEDAVKLTDMNKAFPRLTEKQMRTQYGTASPAGSSDFDNDDDEVGEDESWD